MYLVLSLDVHFLTCIYCSGHPDEIKDEKFGCVGDKYTGTCNSRYKDNKSPSIGADWSSESQILESETHASLWGNVQRERISGKANREADRDLKKHKEKAIAGREVDTSRVAVDRWKWREWAYPDIWPSVVTHTSHEVELRKEANLSGAHEEKY